MVKNSTRILSAIALVTTGLLGGCAGLSPEPIDRTRHETEEPSATTSERIGNDDTPIETGIEGDIEKGPSNNKDIEDIEESIKETSKTDASDDKTEEGGEKSRTKPTTRHDATSDKMADTDDETTVDDAVTEDESATMPQECLMSFRGDVTFADYPLPQSGKTDSYLPSIIAITNRHSVAVEMAVTYEPSVLPQTNEFHNEATRLGDKIRRETVKLIRAGVTKPENLEDTLAEILMWNDSPITDIDVYNTYEVEAVTASDGNIVYVPVTDGTKTDAEDSESQA